MAKGAGAVSQRKLGAQSDQVVHEPAGVFERFFVIAEMQVEGCEGRGEGTACAMQVIGRLARMAD